MGDDSSGFIVCIGRRRFYRMVDSADCLLCGSQGTVCFVQFVIYVAYLWSAHSDWLHSLADFIVNWKLTGSRAVELK